MGKRIKWEYLTVDEGNITLDVSELDQLGEKGWELISHSIVTSENSGRVLQHYIFKRIKE